MARLVPTIEFWYDVDTKKKSLKKGGANAQVVCCGFRALPHYFFTVVR
jgi:hypothetical protein